MLKSPVFCPPLLEQLNPLLPKAAWQELLACVREGDLPHLEEVILRLGRPMSVTVAANNLPLSFRATEEDLSDTLFRACGGSLYAYRDTLSQGYLPLSGGIRLGVGGQAVLEGGRPVGVGRVEALVFRLPHRVTGVGRALADFWQENGRQSLLICGAPASGKTTLLRDLAILLSSGAHPLRVVVLDTRGELCPTSEGDLLCPLTGYPRGAGLELALRTLSPEVVVLDEIGFEEAHAVREAARAGVPLLASLHASQIEDLPHSRAGRALLASGAFPLLCMIRGRGIFDTYLSKEVL